MNCNIFNWDDYNSSWIVVYVYMLCYPKIEKKEFELKNVYLNGIVVLNGAFLW